MKNVVIFLMIAAIAHATPSKLVLLVDTDGVIRSFRPTSEDAPSSEGEPPGLTFLVVPWQELPNFETASGTPRLRIVNGVIGVRPAADILAERRAVQRRRAVKRLAVQEARLRALERELAADPTNNAIEAARAAAEAALVATRQEAQP